MARMQYSTTKFIKPKPISESLFWTLKKNLSQNPNLDLEPESDSFIEKFTVHFVLMAILVVLIIAFSAFGCETLSGFITLMFIFAIIQFALEAPSYANFLRKKRNYFSKLKKAILESDNYNEFIKLI